MIWYIEDSKRLALERAELDNLEIRHDWLIPSGWRIGERAHLIWEAELLVSNTRRSISLQYPACFPHAPPSVFPRDATERWSIHQYQSGELCLQYGPDNWQPEITGAQMVESAHLLLSMEQGDAKHPPQLAPSRHQTTLGQDARGSSLRLVQTRALTEFLAAMAEGGAFTGDLRCLRTSNKNWALLVRSVKAADGTEWSDLTVPKEYDEPSSSHPLHITHLPASVVLPSIDDTDRFRAALQPFVTSLQSKGASFFVIVLQKGVTRAYWVTDTNVYSAFVIPAEPKQSRLPENHDALASKKIAIVGCGSVGSKIAACLARSGISKYLLVDDDILLPGNLVRNDLDWTYVGAHKADAVARRLNLISSTVDSEVSRQRLGGQEASSAFGTLLTKLSEYDLIVDATADSRLFNFLCTVVAKYRKPLIWAAVYAGGIGGLVARHRPGLDPPPQIMRRQIDEWWSTEDKDPAPEALIDYGLQGELGPLVASDSDVGIIAAHAARFAIDTLLHPDRSIFPASVYLIGLQKGRGFRAPFDTIPITVSGATASPSEATSSEAGEADYKFLVDLLANEVESTRPSESST